MSDILYRITDRFDSLTNSQRVVANYVSENISNVAFNTLDELALKIGVSTTTVIRFARALGYSGYSDMQQDIQSNIKGKVSLPERFSTATSHIKRDQLLLDSFHADIENINQTLASLNESVLRRAVEAIVKANHIYLLGMRGSFSMAHLMATRLGQIKDRLHFSRGGGWSHARGFMYRLYVSALFQDDRQYCIRAQKARRADPDVHQSELYSGQVIWRYYSSVRDTGAFI